MLWEYSSSFSSVNWIDFAGFLDKSLAINSFSSSISMKPDPFLSNSIQIYINNNFKLNYYSNKWREGVDLLSWNRQSIRVDCRDEIETRSSPRWAKSRLAREQICDRRGLRRTLPECRFWTRRKDFRESP